MTNTRVYRDRDKIKSSPRPRRCKTGSGPRPHLTHNKMWKLHTVGTKIDLKHQHLHKNTKRRSRPVSKSAFNIYMQQKSRFFQSRLCFLFYCLVMASLSFFFFGDRSVSLPLYHIHYKVFCIETSLINMVQTLTFLMLGLNNNWTLTMSACFYTLNCCHIIGFMHVYLIKTALSV